MDEFWRKKRGAENHLRKRQGRKVIRLGLQATDDIREAFYDLRYTLLYSIFPCGCLLLILLMY